MLLISSKLTILQLLKSILKDPPSSSAMNDLQGLYLRLVMDSNQQSNRRWLWQGSTSCLIIFYTK